MKTCPEWHGVEYGARMYFVSSACLELLSQHLWQYGQGASTAATTCRITVGYEGAS